MTRTAAIVHVQSLGMRDERGHDVYALALDLPSESAGPRRVQVATHVPPGAHHLLAPGAILPILPAPDAAPGDVLVDWPAALAAMPTAPSPQPAGGATPVAATPAMRKTAPGRASSGGVSPSVSQPSSPEIGGTR